MEATVSEENKRLSRAFTEYMSTGDPALADEVFDRAIVFHGPSGVGEHMGLDAVKAMTAAIRAGLPDWRSTVVDQVAEGDKVVARWEGRGTHLGQFGGVPATGRTVELKGITIERVAGGKIVEVWGAWDELGLMHQMGAIPEPVAAG
jgi:steroid delta-isomerase-like uncharacterized protein